MYISIYLYFFYFHLYLRSFFRCVVCRGLVVMVGRGDGGLVNDDCWCSDSTGVLMVWQVLPGALVSNC